MKANMNIPKSQHKLVALNDNIIYSLVGQNKKEKYLNICEIYNVTNDTWTLGPPLLKPRFFISAAVFNYEIIYAFGGFNTTALKNIEVLRPDKDKAWINIKVEHPDWKPKDESASIQISSKEILIFGGIDSSSGATDEAFIYEPEGNKISKLTNNLKKKEWFAMRSPIKYKGKIYIIGYYTNSLHIYDISNKNWDMIDYTDILK